MEGIHRHICSPVFCAWENNIIGRDMMAVKKMSYNFLLNIKFPLKLVVCSVIAVSDIRFR